MEKFVEESCVRESEHLVPNLPRLAATLFGRDSHFLEWRKSHIDWATAKIKHPDGLVWCPWRKELWLVEAEWKRESNFFEQSRAFASGRVDADSLRKALRKCLDEMAPVINDAARHSREDLVVNNIVNETLERHIHENELRPHVWVILGHDATNFEELRRTYERELQARFKDEQRYLLSMARMFRGETAAFLLLEQHGSPLFQIEKAILVPAVSVKEAASYLPYLVDQSVMKRDVPVVSHGVAGSADIGDPALSNSPTWNSSKLLKIERRILERAELWEEFLTRKQLSVQEFKQLSEFPPKVIAGFIRLLTDNEIATRHGDTFTLCEAAVPNIRAILAKASQAEQLTSETATDDSLASWFESKQHKIVARIFEREALWRAFVEKRQLSVQELKKLSDFPPKAIAGFMRFLTENGLATRVGDTFVLSASAIPHIQRILTKQ